MTQRLLTYWQIWYLTAQNALQETFINRWSHLLFFTGKCLRLCMSLILLWLLKERNVSLAGYSSDQVIVFFLTYQIVDLVSQIFYRGVYTFGQKIRSGEFDFLLAKPVSPLFRALTGNPDLDDAAFAVPTLAIALYLFIQLDLHFTWHGTVLYLVLLGNSFLIATALHILVLVIGILSTEVDNAIWIYRDVMRLGQFPITMYAQPLRFALFWFIPAGLMITIPAQVITQVPVTYSVVTVTTFGLIFFMMSLRIWKWALTQYSSASS